MRHPKVLAALMLATLATACADGAPIEARGSSGSELAGSPYVKLRFAQATESSVSSGPGAQEENLYATGVIEVANVAYQKEIVVHYQGPSGWLDSDAIYYGPAANPANELWSFTTGPYEFLPYYSGEAIDFAVEYTVAGQTAWDNNGGINYVVGVQGGDGSVEPPVALGEDNLKVSDVSLVATSDGVDLSGHVVVKNLAYAKVVTVLASTDGWRTVEHIAATYRDGYPGGLESWAFSQSFATGITSAQLAVVYEVDGASYWDDNLGANYTATL
jgi:hypothetical protein